MAKHLPDYHSPLLALGKKALLWGLLPAGLIFTAFYIVDSFKSSGRQSVRRAVEEHRKKTEELTRFVNRNAEEMKKRLSADPDAIRLEAELSKLTPEERKKRVLEIGREYARKARGN